MGLKLITAAGQLILTRDEDDTILGNLAISLLVARGSWWFNPDFGSRLHLLAAMKYTDDIPRLAEDYCREATQHLLDSGRATKIEPLAERDETDRHRLNIRVVATQADGREITYEFFVKVSG